MGIYYGGMAYRNAQIDAVAATIVTEANQILQAERMYSGIHGCPDISCMWPTYWISTVGTGMSELVSDKELSAWPPMGGTMYSDDALDNPGPQPAYAGASDSAVQGSMTTGSFDNGCYSFTGYTGRLMRWLLAVSGQNYVIYDFSGSTCATGADIFATNAADVTHKNNPTVKVAAAINKATGAVPAGATMWALGLPHAAGPYLNSLLVGYDSTSLNPHNDDSNWFPTFSSNTATLIGNFCFLEEGEISIMCIFGPS